MHPRPQRRHREGGAVLVTVALLLFLMLGFIGLALDYGHLFVIRTELQTATDACALSGAQELNGQPDALTRATNAGIAAGNANNVDLQSASWSGKQKLAAADVSFFDNLHLATTDASKAQYVRCTHTQAATGTPLLHMLSFIPGAGAGVGAATMDVGAFAEATTRFCLPPLAVKGKAGGIPPDYGFARGEWVTLLGKGTASNGQIGWANLDGSTNAAETAIEMQGYCGTQLGNILGTPGVQQSIADIWNTRFGIYKNNDDAATDHPDFTGYVYTNKSWSPGSNAYADFVNKRLAFAGCAASVNACETKNDIKLNAKNLATSGPGGELQTYGTNRRVVALPVVDAGSKVVDFVCMLMLQPLSTPLADVQLEYLGNLSAPASPCSASGLPGSTPGPIVVMLVR